MGKQVKDHLIKKKRKKNWKFLLKARHHLSQPSASAMGLKELVYNERAVMKNYAIIDYCRTSGAVIAGAAAGIMGLTGVYGFLFFIIFSVTLSMVLSMKAGRDWDKYFTTKRQLWFNGVIGGLFTYILVWTFLYGMVHVY